MFELRDNAGLHKSILDFSRPQDFKKKNVLEVGFGDGWFLAVCELSSCNKLLGIEFQSKHTPNLSRTIRSQEADVFTFNQSAGEWDLICAWEVLEHLPVGSENDFFHKIHSLLGPNGFFFLSTPNDHIMSTYFDPAYWFAKHRHYSLQSITKMAEAAGLRVVKFEVRGGFWFLLDLYNLYFSKWILRRLPVLRSFYLDRLNAESLKPSGSQTLLVKFCKRS